MLKCGYNKSQLKKNKKDNGSISSKSDIHCDDLPHQILSCSLCASWFRALDGDMDITIWILTGIGKHQ